MHLSFDPRLMTHGMSFAVALYVSAIPTTNPPPIRATAALGNPLWLGAFGIAATSALPTTPTHAWLTGLTVTALLLLAPAILAMLAGIRTRSGLLACHIIVAQLYVGMQLSPTRAQLAAGPMGLAGLSWTHAVGPAHLLCLFGLAASYLWVTPGMDPPPVQPLPTAAVRAL